MLGIRRAWVLSVVVLAASVLYLVPAGMAAPAPRKAAPKAAAPATTTVTALAARLRMQVHDEGSTVTLRGPLVTVRLYPGTNQVSVVGDAYELKDVIARRGGKIRIPNRPASFLSRQILSKRREIFAKREAFKIPEVKVPAAPAAAPVVKPRPTRRPRRNVKDILERKARHVVPKVAAPDPSWAPRATERRWKWIVIHHSDDLEGNAEKYDRVHREQNNWDSLGYHFVIGNGTMSSDGEVEVGPRWPVQKHGAHARNHELGDNRYNEEGIGICLVGKFDEGGRRPSNRQMDSLVRLTKWLMQRYGVAGHMVLRHCDCCKTQCPGRNFPWADFQRRLR